MPGRRDRVAGGHDVLAVGYNDVTQRIKFRNSWGAWGNNGYGTLPYAYVTDPDLAGDFFRVIRGGSPPPPPPPPPPDAIATLIVSQILQPGQYIVAPADLMHAAERAGITPMQALQIFAAVMAFLADQPITASKLLALITTIATILGKPINAKRAYAIAAECEQLILISGM